MPLSPTLKWSTFSSNWLIPPIYLLYFLITDVHPTCIFALLPSTVPIFSTLHFCVRPQQFEATVTTLLSLHFTINCAIVHFERQYAWSFLFQGSCVLQGAFLKTVFPDTACSSNTLFTQPTEKRQACKNVEIDTVWSKMLWKMWC
jgi:hypothetical protein